MVNKRTTQGLALSLFLVFLGLFTALKFFASQSSLPYYAQYNSQYNYGYNNPYAYNSAYNPYGYYSNLPYFGRGYAAMPSYQCNSIYGCRTTYNSYIHISNALDYTYYTHPELLAPRYMENHQRYARGLWPERFWY